MSQGIRSQVSGVTGSQVTCTTVSRTQSIGNFDTGIGSRIIGSQVTPLGDSDTHGVGLGSQRI